MVQDVATPIRPDSAEQRSPSQRMPDSFSLTNFFGIRSSAASSSVVNRGQFCEYEQHAPQPWQGFSTLVAEPIVSMPYRLDHDPGKWKSDFHARVLGGDRAQTPGITSDQPAGRAMCGYQV